MAGYGGLEPPTVPLTAECSTIELITNIHPAGFHSYKHCQEVCYSRWLGVMLWGLDFNPIKQQHFVTKWMPAPRFISLYRTNRYKCFLSLYS